MNDHSSFWGVYIYSKKSEIWLGSNAERNPGAGTVTLANRFRISNLEIRANAVDQLHESIRTAIGNSLKVPINNVSVILSPGLFIIEVNVKFCLAEATETSSSCIRLTSAYEEGNEMMTNMDERIQDDLETLAQVRKAIMAQIFEKIASSSLCNSNVNVLTAETLQSSVSLEGTCNIIALAAALEASVVPLVSIAIVADEVLILGEDYMDPLLQLNPNYLSIASPVTLGISDMQCAYEESTGNAAIQPYEEIITDNNGCINVCIKTITLSGGSLGTAPLMTYSANGTMALFENANDLILSVRNLFTTGYDNDIGKARLLGRFQRQCACGASLTNVEAFAVLDSFDSSLEGANFQLIENILNENWKNANIQVPVNTYASVLLRQTAEDWNYWLRIFFAYPPL